MVGRKSLPVSLLGLMYLYDIIPPVVVKLQCLQVPVVFGPGIGLMEIKAVKGSPAHSRKAVPAYIRHASFIIIITSKRIGLYDLYFEIIVFKKSLLKGIAVPENSLVKPLHIFGDGHGIKGRIVLEGSRL